jgi:hypothetical protein
LKRADRAAAFLEATRLAGFETAEATRFFGRPRNLPENLDLEPLPAELAELRFLTRFRSLEAAPT